MVDYDYYYYVLDLEPGASLDAIQRAWRLKALAHPDTFAPGPLRQEAARKLTEANVARDELRNWWQKNNCPPPTFGRAQSRQHKRHAPPPPRDAGGAGAGRQPPPGHREPPPGADRPPPRRSKPFGPPGFKKNLKHRFYDFTMRSDSILAGLVFWPMGFILSALPATVLSGLVAVLTGLQLAAIGGGSLYLLLWLVGGFTVLRAFSHDYDLYKLQETPFVDGLFLSPADAIERMVAALRQYNYAGQKWDVAATIFDRQEGIYTVVGQFRINSAIYKMVPANYCLTITMKVCEADEPGASLISYWFDVQAPLLWKHPADSIARQTDDLLRKCLNLQASVQ